MVGMSEWRTAWGGGIILYCPVCFMSIWLDGVWMDGWREGCIIPD